MATSKKAQQTAPAENQQPAQAPAEGAQSSTPEVKSTEDEADDKPEGTTSETAPAENQQPAQAPAEQKDEVAIDNNASGEKQSDITTITVDVQTSQLKPQDDGTVKIIIGYPEDWKGQKFMVDGDIKNVAPETAAQFVELNIAKYHK